MSYPTIPTPYEYALMSQAAYFDKVSSFAKKNPKMYAYLESRGWYIGACIRQGEYFASIWINDSLRQVVISHRGSQNITSWVTDIESVIMGKPGAFVRAAIDMLSHKLVIFYHKSGFRVSTTGHSLGGFLAQICMYWAERRDFQAQNATLYPASGSDQAILPFKLSAVVFDSPGVASFIKRLHSNLLSEQATVDFRQLNVHNFCAMPTIVSTYGTQIGTIWHLGGVDELPLAFVNAHQMKYILQGFDSKTGQPKRFRQMTDWPRADYSAYSTLSCAIETSLSTVLKAPFAILNSLYKHIKGNHSNTWFDQLCSEQNQILETLNHRVSKEGSVRALPPGEMLDLAIKAHYSALSIDLSRHHLPFYHIDLSAQVFLKDLQQAKKWGVDTLGWYEALQLRYGSHQATFLTQIKLVRHGKRTELILPADYPGTVFDAHRQLLSILDEHGTLALADFMREQIVRFREATYETSQSTQDIQTLYAKISQLETHIQEQIIMSLQEQWFTAATEGNIGLLNGLLGQDRHLLGERDEEGHTALLLAAKSGQTKTIEFLVEQGALIYATNNKRQNAAYLLISHTRNIPALVYLAKTGKLNLNQPEINGITPLMLAAYHGHSSFVEALCALSVNIEAKSGTGWTASALARKRGHHSLADFMESKINSSSSSSSSSSSTANSTQASSSSDMSGDSGETLNLSDVSKELQRGFPHLLRSRNQRLVMLIGDTRIGKSVIASALSGYEMEEFDYEGELKVKVKGDKGGYTKIGHDFTSETPFAIPAPSPGLPFLWVDCAGFNSQKSLEEGVAELLSFELTIAQAESIDGIIHVIHFEKFQNELTNISLQPLLLRLDKLFTDPMKVIRSLCFAVSQKPKSMTDEAAIAIIKRALEKRCSQLKAIPKSKWGPNNLTPNERARLIVYMTYLMENLGQFVLFDPLDGGISSRRLIELVNNQMRIMADNPELKISKEDFNFSSNYDGSKSRFDKTFNDLLDQNNDLLESIDNQKNETLNVIEKINKTQLYRENTKDQFNALSGDISSKNKREKLNTLIKSLEKAIFDSYDLTVKNNIKIEKNSDKIKKIDNMLKKIDTDDLIKYDKDRKKSAPSYFSTIRVWEDWCIDRLKFSFNTEPVPISQVSRSVKPTGYGEWNYTEDNRSRGKYSSSYLAKSIPFFSESVVASVSIYVNQRDLPDNVTTIKNMRRRIGRLKKENIELRQTLIELQEERREIRTKIKEAKKALKGVIEFENVRKSQMTKIQKKAGELERLLVNLACDLKDHQSEGTRLLECYRTAYKNLEIILTLGWQLKKISGENRHVFNALLNKYLRLQRHLRRGDYSSFGWTAADQEKYTTIDYQSGVSYDSVDDVLGYAMTSSVALTPQGVLLDEFALLNRFLHGYHEPIRLDYPDGTSEVLLHNQWHRGSLSEMQRLQQSMLNATYTPIPTVSGSESWSPEIIVDSLYTELQHTEFPSAPDILHQTTVVQEAEHDIYVTPTTSEPISSDISLSSAGVLIVPPPPPPPPQSTTESLPKRPNYLLPRAPNKPQPKIMPRPLSKEEQLRLKIEESSSRLPPPPPPPTTDSENEWSDDDMELEFGFKIDARSHIPSNPMPDMGPRYIPGWQFFDVPENNCFYEAVINQLQGIHHPWISTLSDNDNPEIILAARVGDISLDREKAIATLARELNITLAIVNVNEMHKGFVAYYIDANDVLITNQGDNTEQRLPEDRAIIRVAMRANYLFSSVKMHPDLMSGAIRNAWDSRGSAASSSSSVSDASPALPPVSEQQMRIQISGRTLAAAPSGITHFTSSSMDDASSAEGANRERGVCKDS